MDHSHTVTSSPSNDTIGRMDHSHTVTSSPSNDTIGRMDHSHTVTSSPSNDTIGRMDHSHTVTSSPSNDTIGRMDHSHTVTSSPSNDTIGRMDHSHTVTSSPSNDTIGRMDHSHTVTSSPSNDTIGRMDHSHTVTSSPSNDTIGRMDHSHTVTSSPSNDTIGRMDHSHTVTSSPSNDTIGRMDHSHTVTSSPSNDTIGRMDHSHTVTSSPSNDTIGRMDHSHTVTSSPSNNNEILKTVGKEKESVYQIEKQLIDKRISPIYYLKKVFVMNNRTIIGSIINYKSPLNFSVKQYNPNFKCFMDQIKSSLSSRYILTQSEVIKYMHVIYKKNQSVHRAQIIDMDPKVKKIKLQLVDEGDEITIERFSKITLYSFVESDCNLPAELVLDCGLSDMWFPVLNSETISLLQPYFNKRILYKILIVKTNETGMKLVQMVNEETNIDISDTILKSGIGQRLRAAMRTDECPYEEKLLKGQSFLSYICNFKVKLYIQPEPNTVDELEEEIQDYINKNPNFEPLDISNLQHNYCLVTIDNQWYRAFIRAINEEFIIVNMFDIGSLAEVNFNQIRPITSNLMKRPQLCFCCKSETNNLSIQMNAKTLYNVTVQSIDTSGMPCVTVKEHCTAPLSNPVIRSLEQISSVYVHGNVTYLQRPQDILKANKMSKTLSQLSGKLESKSSILPGDMVMFECDGVYYRGVVISTNSKMALVKCVDFGYEKQVKKRKLHYLGNSKIALLPAFVTVVRTFPMAFNMSKTAFLANMFVEDDETLNAVPYNIGVIETQNELMEYLQKGCFVRVTCVNSTKDCWIVPHLFFDRLKIISDKLLKMKSKIIPGNVTDIGSLCAVQNAKTKNWHRALILDKDTSYTNVLLIDSGEQMKVSKTTKLTGDIQIIPNCAIHCHIKSNVEIKNLLNENVECRLISCSQSILKVELFSDNVYESISTQSDEKWTVTISRFESFKKFYVEKVQDENSLTSVELNKPLQVGSIINTQTDKGDGIWYEAEVMALIDNESIIVKILSDGSICKSTKRKPLSDNYKKSYYQCYLDEDFENDIIISNPKYLKFISRFMMSHKWTLKTSSDIEPYKVNLTIDGKLCSYLLYRHLVYNCTNPRIPNDCY